MATKYSVSILKDQKWEGIALFADTANFDAMINFCVTQFANGNSLSTPAENICIIDNETGEILWDYCLDFFADLEESWGGCEPSDLNEDCGFDPYLGCYTEDC